MDGPLEIVFHNVQPSEAVEAAIRERFAKLEKYYDRLTACRVSVEGLHRQHRTGNIYEVHIDMLVPGAQLVVSKQPQKVKERYANPDIYVSIKEAFDAAERQLKRFKRQLREDVQPQSTMFQGQVAEMHPEQDYGYLLTKEGALLYFNRNAVMDGTFDQLAMGDVVHYVEAMGDTGPTAVKVWRGPEHDLDRA
ncbi:HPF/RaiA family ribosome-associated protein [Benzoatithermus flavus]|uniref:HPF/RaiA family ribosome-associated protein n=1 Tax=Benzoatithermus flavus TaxID=3108223 RepID=A0ABU8XLG5_9PROT